jgi:hypothetical protein
MWPYLGFVQVEALALLCHVSLIQIVAAHLILILQEQLAVCDLIRVPAPPTGKCSSWAQQSPLQQGRPTHAAVQGYVVLADSQV